MSALEHLRGLVALGPRASGSPAEAAAAEYAVWELIHDLDAEAADGASASARTAG